MIDQLIITTLLTTVASKGIEAISENVTKDAYNWFKSLFYKDSQPKKIMTELIKSPRDANALNNASAVLNNSIEDDPKYLDYIKEIIATMPTVSNSIEKSKNINTGTINISTGNLHIGDNTYGKK